MQIVRVHHALPVSSTGTRWKLKLHPFMVRIDQDEERVVHDGIAVRVLGVEGAAIEHEAETASPGRAPCALVQLRAAGLVPGDVENFRVVNGGALKEFATAEVVVLPAQMDQVTGEFDQQLLAFAGPPVIPTNLVVLAEGVIVAVLRAAALVEGGAKTGAAS